MVGRWNAGTMVTAGDLVFQGRATGEFVAYHAATGEEAWRFNVGSGISAPPVTYSVDGKQYIAILVGWGGGAAGIGGTIATSFGWPYGVHPRRLITFSLDGEAILPASPPAQLVQAMPDQNMFSVDASLAESGGFEYETVCGPCHGMGVVASGMAPDLRASPLIFSAESFAEVVRDGSRLSMGMPKYADLSDADLLTLRHYIRQAANK